MPSVSSRGFQAIVDSGTSELMLPNAVLCALQGEWSEGGVPGIPCQTQDDCTISIEVDGIGALQAPGLMTCDPHNNTCQLTNWIGDGGDKTIIGYAVLRNYYTHFDRAGVTVGFAAATEQCTPIGALPPLHNINPKAVLATSAPGGGGGGGGDDDDTPASSSVDGLESAWSSVKHDASKGTLGFVMVAALVAVAVVVAAFVIHNKRKAHADVPAVQELLIEA